MINPNRLDESVDGAAHGHLAAVGMAFLLGVALLRELRRRGRFVNGVAEPKILDLIDIVALGTVADVAKLKTLNRAFVTQGLKVMAERRNIGLAALADAARLVKSPTSRDLGFALGPRINAGGRVGKSDLGVRLLTATDPEEARTIAAELDRLNEERRAIEQAVTDQAAEQAAAQADAPLVIVVRHRLAPRRGRDRRQPPQGEISAARRSSSRSTRMASARARAARSRASISAPRSSPPRTVACSSRAAAMPWRRA